MPTAPSRMRGPTRVMGKPQGKAAEVGIAAKDLGSAVVGVDAQYGSEEDWHDASLEEGSAEDGSDFNILPRRKAGAPSTGGTDRSAVVLNRELLEVYFSMSLNAASRELGICATAIKKVCRKLGIAKWPFRDRQLASKKGEPVPELETVSSAAQAMEEETDRSMASTQASPTGVASGRSLKPDKKISGAKKTSKKAKGSKATIVKAPIAQRKAISSQKASPAPVVMAAKKAQQKLRQKGGSVMMVGDKMDVAETSRRISHPPHPPLVHENVPRGFVEPSRSFGRPDEDKLQSWRVHQHHLSFYSPAEANASMEKLRVQYERILAEHKSAEARIGMHNHGYNTPVRSHIQQGHHHHHHQQHHHGYGNAPMQQSHYQQHPHQQHQHQHHLQHQHHHPVQQVVPPMGGYAPQGPEGIANMTPRGGMGLRYGEDMMGESHHQRRMEELKGQSATSFAAEAGSSMSHNHNHAATMQAGGASAHTAPCHQPSEPQQGFLSVDDVSGGDEFKGFIGNSVSCAEDDYLSLDKLEAADDSFRAMFEIPDAEDILA